MKKALSAIRGEGYKILFSEEAYDALHSLLRTENYSSVYILVDNHTQIHCLPIFLGNLSELKKFDVLKINAGEEYKHLKTCQSIWQDLSKHGADRRGLLINLGGGVVTDLGGFVAAAFKRGIDFVNIPTSLLGMVDASIGGKTGIDLKNIKNIIGSFYSPEITIIDTHYLNTLPIIQFKCGLSEIIKHSLIKGENDWSRLKVLKNLKELIII